MHNEKFYLFGMRFAQDLDFWYGYFFFVGYCLGIFILVITISNCDHLLATSEEFLTSTKGKIAIGSVCFMIMAAGFIIKITDFHW